MLNDAQHKFLNDANGLVFHVLGDRTYPVFRNWLGAFNLSLTRSLLLIRSQHMKKHFSLFNLLQNRNMPNPRASSIMFS